MQKIKLKKDVKMTQIQFFKANFRSLSEALALLRDLSACVIARKSDKQMTQNSLQSSQNKSTLCLKWKQIFHNL